MRFYHAAFLVAGLASAAAATGADAPADAPADAASLRGARQLQPGTENPCATASYACTPCPQGQSPLYVYFHPDYSSADSAYFALHDLCADGYPEVASFTTYKETKPSNFFAKGMEGETKVVMGSVCLPRTGRHQYKVVIMNMEEVRFNPFQYADLIARTLEYRSKFGYLLKHAHHLILGGSSQCPVYFNCGFDGRRGSHSAQGLLFDGDHGCPFPNGRVPCDEPTMRCD